MNLFQQRRARPRRAARGRREIPLLLQCHHVQRLFHNAQDTRVPLWVFADPAAASPRKSDIEAILAKRCLGPKGPQRGCQVLRDLIRRPEEIECEPRGSFRAYSWKTLQSANHLLNRFWKEHVTDLATMPWHELQSSGRTRCREAVHLRPH